MLPVLTGTGYEGDAISDGIAAAREYLGVLVREYDWVKRARVLTRLREYCMRDRSAMVELVAVLKRLRCYEGGKKSAELAGAPLTSLGP